MWRGRDNGRRRRRPFLARNFSTKSLPPFHRICHSVPECQKTNPQSIARLNLIYSSKSSRDPARPPNGGSAWHGCKVPQTGRTIAASECILPCSSTRMPSLCLVSLAWAICSQQSQAVSSLTKFLSAVSTRRTSRGSLFFLSSTAEAPRVGEQRWVCVCSKRCPPSNSGADPASFLAGNRGVATRTSTWTPRQPHHWTRRVRSHCSGVLARTGSRPVCCGVPFWRRQRHRHRHSRGTGRET